VGWWWVVVATQSPFRDGGPFVTNVAVFFVTKVAL